jgi:hypothetical protein
MTFIWNPVSATLLLLSLGIVVVAALPTIRKEKDEVLSA